MTLPESTPTAGSEAAADAKVAAAAAVEAAKNTAAPIDSEPQHVDKHKAAINALNKAIEESK